MPDFYNVNHDAYMEWRENFIKEPVYCTRCGRKLAPDDRIIGYDAYTGDPIRPNINKKICPSKECRRDELCSRGYFIGLV